MRELQFVETELYHIFNRGVDKRNIFKSTKDLERFIEGMHNFNTTDKLGNIDRNHS